jgi:hypothetical protein
MASILNLPHWVYVIGSLDLGSNPSSFLKSPDLCLIY